MANCCHFIGTVIILITALASLALLLAANVGTIKNQAANSSIFLLELSLADVTTSDISSLLSSSESYTKEELGFSDAYIFGMYGYCRGTQGDTVLVDQVWEEINFKASSCTDPSTGYTFDPVNFILDEINEYNTVNINVTKSDVTLPGGLDTYIKTADGISKAIYVTSIMAICFTLISVLCELLLWCRGGMIVTWFFQFIAFICALISSGCGTGAFKYIVTEFNKYASDYGIHAKLSRNYLVLTWVGTGLSLCVLLFMFIQACMCGGSRERAPPVPEKFDRVL